MDKGKATETACSESQEIFCGRAGSQTPIRFQSDSYLFISAAWSAVDPQAECDVQLIWLANPKALQANHPGHCQHHGPARENHDEQSSKQAGMF